MKAIWRTFLKGLAAVLPVGLTVFLIYWLGAGLEAFFRRVFGVFLPERLELPGMGLLLGIIVVFVMGIAMELWVTRRLLAMLEGLVLQVPVVKSIYGAIRDFTDYFSKASRDQSISQVVMLDLGNGMKVLGFVTRKSCAELPLGAGASDIMAVYLPMSYQIGGYTLYLPRERVQPVDMPIEEAMRLTLTAGVSTSARTHSHNAT
jgi:uncharacterized membrane protein